MRNVLSITIWGLAVLQLASSAQAIDPDPMANRQPIAPEALIELGDAVARIDLYRDNFFGYEAQLEQLTKKAMGMEGGTIDVLLTVKRVTPGEVLCEPSDAGRTRMIIKHAAPPFFGNLGTVWYCAQPSADYWNMLAMPVGLRIGEEITLEMAKVLRKRDVLRVTGRVESMPLRMDGVFQPRVAAVVVDWKVVELIVEPDAGHTRS